MDGTVDYEILLQDRGEEAEGMVIRGVISVELAISSYLLCFESRQGE